MAIASNKPWYKQPVKDVLAYFRVDYTKGLSSQEALKRLAAFGSKNSYYLPKISAGLYRATVFRDSKIKSIAVNNLVFGDIVVISEGDIVPFDLRLIKVNKLAIDESVIGGNHLVYKNTYSQKDNNDLLSPKCMALIGTLVKEGSGVGVVVSDGYARNKQNKLLINQKAHIKNRLLVNRLLKKGLFVQDFNVLKMLKKVNTVIFVGNFDSEFIINAINKLQLQNNIHTLFILSSVSQSLKDALPIESIINYQNDIAAINRTSLQDALLTANIVIDDEAGHFVQIASSLKKPVHKIMAVVNKNSSVHILSAADLSIAVGQNISDQVALQASIRTNLTTPDILASILHNNK